MSQDEANRANAARLLGMKLAEIVEVRRADDGALVLTHDGQWTLIHETGGRVDLEHLGRLPGRSAPVDEATAAMLRGFRGDPDPEPVKPASKRRGRA